MSSPSTSTNPESNASSTAVGPRKRPAEDPADEEEPSKRPRLADTDFSDDVKPERCASGSLTLTPQILNPLKRSAADAETEPPNPGDIDNRAIKKIRLEGETNPTVEQQNLSGDASSSIETRHKRPLDHNLSPDPGDSPPVKRTRVKGARRSRKPQKQRDDALLLPVELHHEILEWMWEDGSFEDDRRELVGTLRACARTCSRWRSAARPLIFRFVMIKRPSRLNDLVALIQEDPQIARWIQKVRLDGTSIPNDDYRRRPLGAVEEDKDRWIYAFPLKIGVPLPSLKRLELTCFAHLSEKREDQEAFAHWIRELAELRSVVELNMLRCEMSSSSLTALVRAFPLLVRVGFASVDFSAQNFTIIREESLPPKPSSQREGSGTDIPDSETVSVDETSVRPTPHDALGTSPSSLDHPTLPVQYPLLHPPPSLQSFTVNNLCTDFFEFDFLLLRDWFCPEILAKSLKSLDVSSWVDDLTLAKFIASLGTSPALECLTLWVGWGLRYYMRSTVDIHHLTNLTSIRLVTERTLERDEVDAMQYVLSQVNAPRLQAISISIPAIRTFKVLEGMDEYLAKEFGGIKKLCVETYTDGPEEEKKAREEVTAMFPLMAERGVLRVEDRDIPYLL